MREANYCKKMKKQNTDDFTGKHPERKNTIFCILAFIYMRNRLKLIHI